MTIIQTCALPYTLYSNVLPDSAKTFLFSWRSKVDNFFSNYFSTEAIAKKLCGGKVITTGGGNAALYNVGGDAVRTAAHVEGTRERIVTSDGSEKYAYLVTVFVSPPKTGSITFDVVLRGAGEKALASRVEVNAGTGPYAKTLSDPLLLNDTASFTEACIKFRSGKEKFDVAYLDGDYLCNQVGGAP